MYCINKEMDDQGDNNQPTSKRVRLPTRLKSLTRGRAAGQKRPIEFHEKTGNPLGPNKSKFKSYVALQGRCKVSLLKQNWEEVESTTKDLIWESIMVYHYKPLCLLFFYLFKLSSCINFSFSFFG